MHGKQEIRPNETNGLDFDKVLGEARCGLLMLQADMSQSCGLPFSKSNDCTQLGANCAELIH